MRALNLCWHTTCFTCWGCGAAIEDDEFMPHNNRPYHVHCHPTERPRPRPKDARAGRAGRCGARAGQPKGVFFGGGGVQRAVLRRKHAKGANHGARGAYTASHSSLKDSSTTQPHLKTQRPPPPGTCLNFHSEGWGDPSPLDPLPPSPLSSSAAEKQGSGNFLIMSKEFSRRLRRMSYIVSLLSTVYSASLVLQSTMSQRSLSSFFSSPVQPPPRAKREDVINALLYFRFKDRITGRKRQEAYNDAQKACATLFLSVPIATLCNFVAVAQQMGTRDRAVRCLPHEFHAMQSTVCARWAAQLPRTQSHLAHMYFLSFTAPTAVHCAAPEVPHRTTTTPKKVSPVQTVSTPTTPETVLEVPWEKLIDSVKKVAKTAMGTPHRVPASKGCTATGATKIS